MMTRYFSILFSLIICADSQMVNSSLRCRLCHRASTLSDCSQLVICDRNLEDCYMDELITSNLSVVYEGGCRSKDICNQPGVPVGKRQAGYDLVACSRCCNFQEDCNKRLCGIKDDTLNSSQCYNCNRGSGQPEVKDPRECVTLSTCAPNEMCYTSTSDVGGVSKFFYGCLDSSACKILMKQAWEDYRTCVFNETMPPAGIPWFQYCGEGGQHRRSTDVCHACCADGGCNYGTCEELKARMFTLYRVGKLDLNTLRFI